MRRVLITFVLALVVGLAMAPLVVARQSTQTYTCSWTHDGVNTTGYAIAIDGTRAVVSPTCTGTGDTRSCSTPITMTTGAAHTVIVTAFNDFGEAAADPFSAGPPGKAKAVLVKK